MTTITGKRYRKRIWGLRNSGINPKGFHPSQIKFYLILLPLIVLMLLPIIFIFSHAFKPPDELFAYPPRFFVTNPTFKNFTDLFTKMSNSGIPVTRYLFNSIFITAVTVGSSILVSSTAAYA
ncbi:carbohydrate ABC transporter permease, partial [bacterium]|nr:carbohydrate ABC transporter permease [bacterium]